MNLKKALGTQENNLVRASKRDVCNKSSVGSGHVTIDIWIVSREPFIIGYLSTQVYMS